MSDRERILGRIRRVRSRERAHPGRYRPAAPEASWSDFAERLAEAAGEALGPLPASELAGVVRARLEELGAGSCLAEPRALAVLGAGPWQSAVPPRPARELAGVDVAIAVAALGVAENGAAVLDAELAAQRPLLLLCEHLILLLDARDLVPDVHTALERLGPEGVRAGCVTWVAGPSKTSDIEQALVVGAHGPRSLTVLGVLPSSSTLEA
jgi:L-lactate dehydrogenase complex protein LldG